MIINEAERLALIIFSISQTLVYLHMPLYKANKTKNDNLIEITPKIFPKLIMLITSTGKEKSNLNKILNVNDEIIKMTSRNNNIKRFLFVLMSIYLVSQIINIIYSTKLI